MNRRTGSQNASSSSSNNNKNKEKEQKDQTIEKIRIFVLEKVTEYIEKYEGDLKKILKLQICFFFFVQATEWAMKYHSPTGPVEPARPGGDRSGPCEKNLFSKRTGFGLQVLTCGSGSDIEKPDPNPTRCHSYSQHPEVK